METRNISVSGKKKFKGTTYASVTKSIFGVNGDNTLNGTNKPYFCF